MKIIKYLVVGLFLVFLAGCDPNDPEEPKNITEKYILPGELKAKGCEIYLLNNGISNLRVVYCPNAQVTTSRLENKVMRNTTVIAE